jgi:hypothetical protein
VSGQGLQLGLDDPRLLEGGSVCDEVAVLGYLLTWRRAGDVLAAQSLGTILGALFDDNTNRATVRALTTATIVRALNGEVDFEQARTAFAGMAAVSPEADPESTTPEELADSEERALAAALTLALSAARRRL